jgi:hypothetical protein
MEGAMKVDLWNRSVPRVELDQRARDARLQLERLVPDLLEKKNPQGNGSNTTAGSLLALDLNQQSKPFDSSSSRPRHR